MQEYFLQNDSLQIKTDSYVIVLHVSVSEYYQISWLSHLILWTIMGIISPLLQMKKLNKWWLIVLSHIAYKCETIVQSQTVTLQSTQL